MSFLDFWRQAALEHHAVDDGWRGHHRPAGPNYGSPLHDVENSFPDFYEHPEYYNDYDNPGMTEATHAVMRARGKPDAKVRVYRALPLSARADIPPEQAGLLSPRERKGWFPIGAGDWVSTSYDYAKQHGEANLSGQPWTVATTHVPASQLWTEGNFLPEWGYGGENTWAQEHPRAKNERYRRASATLDSVNPTGGMFVDYDPTSRVVPLGGKMTTLDRLRGVHPDEPLTVYRGAPTSQHGIVPGDFITTNRQLAQDYAGQGSVLTLKIPAGDVAADPDDWEGEEYIYHPRRTAAAVEWYHISPHKLPATVISPGGGDSPYTQNGFYNQHGGEGRQQHVWVTPQHDLDKWLNTEVVSDWVREQHPKNHFHTPMFVYKVQPHARPQPFDPHGQSGYTTPSATVEGLVGTGRPGNEWPEYTSDLDYMDMTPHPAPLGGDWQYHHTAG